MKSLVCTFAFFALLAPAAAQTPGVPSIPPDYWERPPAQSQSSSNSAPLTMSQNQSQSGMSQADAQAQAAAQDDQDAYEQDPQQPAPEPPYPPDQSAQQQYPQDQPPYPDQQASQPPYAEQPQQAPYPQQQYPQQSQTQPYPQDQASDDDGQQAPYPQQPPYPDQPPAPQAPPVYYPQPHVRVAPQRPVQHVVRPRPDASAYPTYREEAQFAVGARLLSPDEVERRFATPLGKHYLVVEVGFYPASAQPVTLRTDSFTLRANKEDQAFFPATPDDVLTDLRNSSGPRIYPSVGVGYERGPWGSGVGTGVGVGVGPSGPYPSRRTSVNRQVMLAELREKALPEGNLTQPTAGYLYFPLSGKRAKQYTLELYRNGEVVSLPLPIPKD